jgi:hypothetical protein
MCEAYLVKVIVMFRQLYCAAALVFLATWQHAAAQTAFPATTVAACQKISGPAKISTVKVRFKTGATGKIVLACPVDSTAVADLASTKRIVMHYRDATGTGKAASVRAKLFVTNSSTGAVSITPHFDSDDYSTTIYDAQLSTVTLPTFDPDSFTYSIQIELRRSNASKVVEFYSFAIVDL